jgi:hypothetical protein
MGFKLRSDSISDMPIICCDVCDQPIFDIWNDKVTGTPTNGQTTDVTIHHAACTSPPGSVTMSLIEFLKLFVTQNRVGDLGSDGTTEKVTVEYPTGKGFEV